MKIIKLGQEARESIKRGIDTVADCVKLTLGPSGRNAIIGRIGIAPLVTNDGVTIARNIECENEFEELGAQMVKEASFLADIKAGDGTTTTTVLLQKLSEILLSKMQDTGSLVQNKIDTMALKKEVDRWCDIVCEKLKEKSRAITEKDIYDVAITSAEHEHIARMVTDIFTKIGKDGYVTIEEGRKTEYEVFSGMEIPVGYESDYLINNDKRECVVENAHILVTNEKILSPAVIAPLVGSLIAKEVKELIIVAPDFSRDTLNRFNTTHINSGFSIIALKLPIRGNEDKLRDVATFVGAKFIDNKSYAKPDDLLKDLNESSLGKSVRAVIGSNKTVFVGGSGDTNKLVGELKTLITNTTSEFDKDTLEQRMASLSGGTAIIRVGSASEAEQIYTKLKFEDAINAVPSALNGGVVRGGGLALKEIAEELEENILTEAIKAPYNQIQENSGGLEIGDNVLDPLTVTQTALKTACSLAGMLITTEVAVAIKNEKHEQKNTDVD